jgi:hypothetical protein
MWKTLGGFTAQISQFQHILPRSTAQINCSGSDLPFFRKPYVNHSTRTLFLERSNASIGDLRGWFGFRSVFGTDLAWIQCLLLPSITRRRIAFNSQTQQCQNLCNI